jgi:hypothetical protein
MAKRAAREAAEKAVAPAPAKRAALKKTIKIGRPGYRVTKQFDPDTAQRALLFQVRRRRRCWLGCLAECRGLGRGCGSSQGAGAAVLALL